MKKFPQIERQLDYKNSFLQNLLLKWQSMKSNFCLNFCCKIVIYYMYLNNDIIIKFYAYFIHICVG